MTRMVNQLCTLMTDSIDRARLRALTSELRNSDFTYSLFWKCELEQQASAQQAMAPSA